MSAASGIVPASGVVSAADVTVDPSLAALVPRGVAEAMQAVPIDLSGDLLTIAMLDPVDVFLTDELQRITGKRIRALPINPPDLRTLIGRVYQGRADDDIDFVGGTRREGVVQLGAVSPSAEAPTVLLLNEVLQQAINQRASDIHIEPYEKQCLIRFRIDGVLYDFQPMNPEQHIPLLSRIKILSNIDIAE